MIFNLFGVFDDFSFSTKGSIHVISVGMERSNGIPMEIFRLREREREREREKDVVRKTWHMTYMNKYIVMFSYENMMSAHIPIFAVLLLDQNIVVDTVIVN